MRSLRVIYVLLVVGTSVFLGGPAHAAPSQGPDPADFTASSRYGDSYPTSGRTVDYAVATSTFNTILTTSLNVYLPSPSGTIVIHNQNICYATFRNGGRNYDQLEDGVINSSGNAVSFKIGATTKWGAFDGSSTCDSKTLSFPVSGAALDPNTNMYKYTLTVSANPATDKYNDTFWVTAPAGSYVSQNSTLSSSSFGMEQTSPIPGGNNPPGTQTPPDPYRDYANYLIRFAPDCSLLSGNVSKTIQIYDDDNRGNWDVQPKPFLVKLIEVDGVTGAKTTVPLSFSFPDGSGGVNGPDGSGYYEAYTTTSGKHINITFTAKFGKKYQWLVDSVYYDNTLQFKIPYDSVFYYTGCAQSAAQLKAGMTATPSTMSQEDTASFAPTVSVASFSGPVTVNCTITRTFFAASGGSSSLGNQPCQTPAGSNNIPVTGNGTIALKVNTYSSPGTAVPGSRICDTITITSPSGPQYFASPSDNTSTSCVVITKTPLVQFLGGDVWAGGGFAAVAPGTCKTSAKITTSAASAMLSDGTFAGSGVAYGAFALDKITNFGSASYALTSGGTGDAWTFSNINTGNLGFFGAPQHCINDYVATYQSSPALSPGVIDVSGGASGSWHITGNTTIHGTMSAGLQKVYLVTGGDVTIDADIKYPATFSSVASIPSTVIITTGNIFVAAGVHQLDGIYIARGTFYTCYPKVEPATINTCNSNLTINGSVSATGLDLFRTAGADGGTPATRKSAAETFNLSPEVYINDALNSSTSQTITTSSVRELPPRF